jgi:glycosyltransferase involved in cell wall biosynthesis
MQFLKTPKLSVVIPTYNRSKFLIDIFECLLTQTFKDFEVIISDDGSVDDTKKIVELFSAKINIIYLYNENWGGPAFPRNNAIKHSNADWICFLDSDDLWKPNKLSTVYDIIKHDKKDIIFHKFCVLDGFNKHIIGGSKNILFKNFFNTLLYEGNFIVNSSLCIRKSKIIEVGYLSEDKKLIGVEDYDLLLKLAKANSRIHFINKVLGEYRIHNNNISCDSELQISKIKLVLNKYKNISNSQKINSLLNYFRARHEQQNKNYNAAFKLYLSILTNDSSLFLKLKSFYFIFKNKLK